MAFHWLKQSKGEGSIEALYKKVATCQRRAEVSLGGGGGLLQEAFAAAVCGDWWGEVDWTRPGASLAALLSLFLERSLVLWPARKVLLVPSAFLPSRKELTRGEGVFSRHCFFLQESQGGGGRGAARVR